MQDVGSKYLMEPWLYREMVTAVDAATKRYHIRFQESRLGDLIVMVIDGHNKDHLSLVEREAYNTIATIWNRYLRSVETL